MRSATWNRLLSFLFVAALGAGLLAGCSDDPAQPQDTSGTTQQNGVLQAQGLSAGSSSFEIESHGDDPARPGRGRFGLRGSNLHYDTDLGALVVDLTAVNRSESTFPEPVTLTFLALLPAGTTVLNADNGQTGPGAQITFTFANDDAQWTPGEESFPRTVQFGVAQGVSIAFVGRIDVGVPQGSGAIGGVVWNDADRDGVMGPEETGVGGAAVRVTGEGIEPRMALTHEDGSYRVDGLAAGAYTVRLLPSDRFEPTTPPDLTVLLTEANGEVSDFLAASFGVARHPIEGPPRIEPGDRVNVTGDYVPPDAVDAAGTTGEHKVVATTILVHKHFETTPLGNTMPPLDGRDDPAVLRFPGWLAGPVTGIELETRRLQVMGTWVAFPPPDTGDDHDGEMMPPGDSEGTGPPDRGDEVRLEDVQVGDRILVRAVELVCPACTLVDPIRGWHIFQWAGEAEKVVGRVTNVRVEDIPDGTPKLLGLTALGTHVEVTDDTVIRVVWDW